MQVKVQILVDNPNSWIIPYAKKLVALINEKDRFYANLLTKGENVVKGDILFLLSCEELFKALHLNKHTLVVHESDLPKGKGWSPVSWQVLEGKNKIPITLFEAVEKVDAGKIYYQDSIVLKGDELFTEIKHKQGLYTQKLVLQFLDTYPNVKGIEQEGKSTFYAKRTPKDSELDIHKTIDEQFNLLRICDNDNYPAFFIKNGVRYDLKISKSKKK